MIIISLFLVVLRSHRALYAFNIFYEFMKAEAVLPILGLLNVRQH
jgi:hypothetical protein